MKLYLPIIALSLSGVLAVDNNDINKASLKKTVDTSKAAFMQHLLGPARSAGHNIRGTKDSRRLQEEICLPNYRFRTDEGCTIRGLAAFTDNLEEELSDVDCTHDAFEELQLVLDVDSEDAVIDFFWDTCFEFWSSQEGANFAEIGDGTDLFIKEFFDGKFSQSRHLAPFPYKRHSLNMLRSLYYNSSFLAGGTYWNEARETTTIDGEVVNVLSEDPGEKITRIQRGVAERGLIDLPEQITNFESCEARVAMCCWVSDRQADDDNGDCETPYDEDCVNAEPSDNTDVCAVNLGRAQDSNNVNSGVTLFPGGREGETHCHGFAWTEDDIDTSNIFKGNNLFHISAFDHLVTRGYVKNVPGAPMCGCVEQMPIVSRADCTEMELVQATTFAFQDGTVEVTPSGEWEVEFNSCVGRGGEENDLGAYVERLFDERRVTGRDLRILRKNVVGDDNCPAIIESFIDNLVAAQEMSVP
jgi:hypothetical protein